jgi:hypothetical protein|tara:strand:+ start:2097 stop:2294 length:198 start_codon:yes stop_codon:yes gene_type:complete
MNTYNYQIESWYQGEEVTFTDGRGGFTLKDAKRNMRAALKRTDKVEGLYAMGRILSAYPERQDAN